MNEQNKLIKTYRDMLENIHAFLTQADITLSKNSLEEAANTAREKAKALQELSHQDIHEISHSLEKDVHHFMHYLQETKEDVKQWFPFEVELTEALWWEKLSTVADPTTLTLKNIKKLAKATRHTGEIVAPGIFICTNCGEKIQTSITTHLTHCPTCKKTTFYRQNGQKN